MNGPFPLLDNLGLRIEHPDADEDESEGDKPELPQLPQLFQAPHLYHLNLSGVGNVTEVGLPCSLLSATSYISPSI